MNRDNPLVQFCDAFMGKRNLSKKGAIIVIVVTAAIMLGCSLYVVYAQEEGVSEGLEGLSEAARELECKIDAMESNETEVPSYMQEMDRLKCSMGDLIK